MYHEIGEVFEINGRKYKAIEAVDNTICYNCAFEKSIQMLKVCCAHSLCTAEEREDGRSVDFVEVE